MGYKTGLMALTLLGMGVIKIIAAWLEVQALKTDIEHHCEHQAVGSCSDECADIVLGERW